MYAAFLTLAKVIWQFYIGQIKMIEIPRPWRGMVCCRVHIIQFHNTEQHAHRDQVLQKIFATNYVRSSLYSAASWVLIRWRHHSANEAWRMQLLIFYMQRASVYFDLLRVGWCHFSSHDSCVPGSILQHLCSHATFYSKQWMMKLFNMVKIYIEF